MELGQVLGDIPGTVGRHTVDKPQNRPGAGGKAHFARVNARTMTAHFHHLIAQQVVAQQHAPQLLLDRLGRLAAQRIAAVEQRLFHLPKAKFELPSLAVQVNNLVGREA